MKKVFMTFACPKCGQYIEADSTLAGRSGDCPECGKHITVPMRAVPPHVIAKPTPPQTTKTLEDHVVDGICGSASLAKNAVVLSAKLLWNIGRGSTKIVAPVAGRIGGKVAGRAFESIAATPTVQRWVNAPPPKPPGFFKSIGNALRLMLYLIRFLFRIFGG